VRCGYTDDSDDDPLAHGRWRAQVQSAMRGKRGQRFFRELIAALDALPEPRLIKNDLVTEEGAFCALGALGHHKNIDVSTLDTEDYDRLGDTFDIAHQLAQETMWVNDEAWRSWVPCGPQLEESRQRWRTVRAWAVANLAKAKHESEFETGTQR